MQHDVETPSRISKLLPDMSTTYLLGFGCLSSDVSAHVANLMLHSLIPGLEDQMYLLGIN